MKLFIFILLSFSFLNSSLVYASDLKLDSNQGQSQIVEQAQNDLGDRYLEDGLSVIEEDAKEAAQWFKEAVRLYKEAAEQGYAKAQFNMGVMYEAGLGVEADLKEAVRWYRKAAEQEYAPAQFQLGVMYEEGLGVEKDPEEAARWFEKAAEQGYVLAQNIVNSPEFLEAKIRF